MRAVNSVNMRLSVVRHGTRRSIFALWLTFGILVSFAHAQRGAIVTSRNLADLSSIAEQIIHGRVRNAVVEPHPLYPHLSTVVVTLAVEDSLKGASTKEITFRQFIWDLRDISSQGGYRRGDELLLFLNRPTALGLTSPVGLDQGRFRVMTAPDGGAVALNGSGNSGLLDGVRESGTLNVKRLSPRSRLAVQNFAEGAISLQALKDSVRLILQTRAGTK